MLALISRVSIWIEDLCKYRFMNIGNMMYGVNVVNNVGSSHIISKLKTARARNVWKYTSSCTPQMQIVYPHQSYSNKDDSGMAR